MVTKDDLGNLRGTEVYDNEGERIGPVGEIYVDPRTGDPQWVTVRTGTFGFQESFVPLSGARLADGRITVAVRRDRVKQAPLLDTGAPLEFDDADRLEAHYGRTTAADSTDDAMTRSEERLVTGTRTEPVERVRLRKYVVTEERQITVPVTREEVRLERVPVTADEPADEAAAGPPADMILQAEEPVVTTRTVPVERVRLGRETVRDEETVTHPVRRERIEYEGPTPAGG